jgi:hypothetical protein
MGRQGPEWPLGITGHQKADTAAYKEEVVAPKASQKILIHTKKEHRKAIFKDKSCLSLSMTWKYFPLPFSCPRGAATFMVYGSYWPV